MNKTTWLIIGIAGAVLFFIPDPLDAIIGFGTVLEAIIGIIGLYKAVF